MSISLSLVVPLCCWTAPNDTGACFKSPGSSASTYGLKAHRDDVFVNHMRHREAAVGEDVYEHVGRHWVIDEELVVRLELCMPRQAAPLQQRHRLIVNHLDDLRTAVHTILQCFCRGPPGIQAEVE